MGELRLRVATSYGPTDVLVRFDGQVTMGQLADELEATVDKAAGQPRSIQRMSRGEAWFTRDTRVAQADLRSGDEIRLALDTGLRAVGGSPATATIRVVGGPDAGRAFELRRGESVIGRSSSCTVTLSDDMASRRHAVVRVSDIIEIADSGSTNGILVNDEPVTGVQRLRPGDRVLIGDSTLVVDVLNARHDAVDVVDNAVEFNRPPRIERPFEPSKVVLPAPLDPPPKQRLPMAASIVPLVMGAVMYVVFPNPLSVVFLAMSPLMAVASFIENRVSGRKDHAVRVQERAAVLADQVALLDRYRNDEVRSAFRFAPGPGDLRQCVDELSPLLWERVPDDQDFLRFRVGLRAQPSTMEIEVAQGGRREDRADVEQIADAYRELPPVPVTVEGRADGPLGVAGPPETRRALVRSLLLQAAVLHSPNELLIGAIVPEEAAEHWSWIKWLPHTRLVPPGVKGGISAVGVDDGIEVIAALQDLVEARLAVDRRSTEPAVHVPHVLVLVDGSIAIDRARFALLLDDGRRAGVTLLWEVNDPRRVPNSCGVTISIEPGGERATVGVRSAGTELPGVAIEGAARESAEIMARSLAPIVDLSTGAAAAAPLPTRVSLVDLLGGLEVLDSPQPILERWTQSAGQRHLRAPVGAYEGGPFQIDLRVDGPHGLVGGTTGAGKSEFLQALLAGLAANHSPQRLNFLLVDYKGGSAFGGLVDQFDHDGTRIARGLPHTVGMITDLTPALVDRALESLQAELHRREKILAGPPRMQDLVEMEKKGLPDTPPSLIIVVDEFAALAKEVPRFVDGVVDIAQRGRSLGLHLVLATQKPGGVVTANIQANTNLRVALRTASEEESRDLVNAPDAGLIDRTSPGRGVIRRGPSDLVRFQSSYVGGVTRPATASVVEVAEFDLGQVRVLSKARAEADDPNVATDLTRLVAVINAAWARLGQPEPRKPWLNPLPATVNLLKLLRPTDDGAVVYGVVDLPHAQSRELAAFRPDIDGSLLIYGMGGTGKTVALRTIGAAFGLTKDRSPVHVHGLDFAGRGLDMLDVLPHVGSIIPGDDYERTTRLLAMLKREIDERSARMAAARTSTLTEYRRATGDLMPRIVVLFDGYDNFLGTYERVDRGEWADLVPRLVADGRQRGVHFVFTGTRRASFPLALASQVRSRLVFRMASDDDYHAVNVNPKWFDAATPPGRGRLGGAEVQVAIVGSEPTTADEAETLRRLGHRLRDLTAEVPAIRSLPDEVALSDLPPTIGVAWALTDAFVPVGPDLSQNVLIVGPRGSGRSIALASLYRAALDAGLPAHLFDAGGRGGAPGAGSVEDLAKHLDQDDPGIVLIDDVEAVANGSANVPLQEAMQSRRVVVVGATDIGSARTLGGYEPTMKALRSRCDTLLLQPTAGVDDDVLGGPIPRTSHRFPPGRGYLHLRGRIHLVQVATPN